MEERSREHGEVRDSPHRVHLELVSENRTALVANRQRNIHLADELSFRRMWHVARELEDLPGILGVMLYAESLAVWVRYDLLRIGLAGIEDWLLLKRIRLSQRWTERTVRLAVYRVEQHEQEILQTIAPS